MEISFTGENFEHHWGFINWRDKIILDIGADYGSTADCFLTVGASKVYASEGDIELYKKLVEHAKGNDRIIPSSKLIFCPNDFIDLFNEFRDSRIDICKMDCERAEIHLLEVSDDMLRSIREYAIECHSPDILNKVSDKFKKAGFNIVNTKLIGENLGNDVYVMYVVRRQ